MSEDIASINYRLSTSLESPLDELGGLEILIESFSIKVIDVMGKNSLLAIAYQIGSEPASKVSKRLLTRRNGELFVHPVEAFVTLMETVRNYFRIQILSIEGIEPGPITVSFRNRCYFRSSVMHRPSLKIGGALCRITKGYIETAIASLTNWKAEVSLIGQDEEHAECVEQVVFIK